MEKYHEEARKNLDMLISYLGITAKVESQGDEQTIKLTVSSEDAGRIIGRKGRTLSAIQLLLNSIMRKDETFDSRIVISIDGYEKRPRERKEGGDRNRNRNRNRKRRRDENPRDDEQEFDEFDEFADMPEAVEEVAEEAVVEATEEIVEQPVAVLADGVEEMTAKTEQREVRAERPRRDDRHDDRRGPRREHRNERRDDRRDDRRGPRREREDRPATPADNDQFRRQQAIDAAKEVKRWGESVTLRGGMNGNDRKLIVEALSAEKEIEVIEGEVVGPDTRRVTIQLKA